MTIGPPVLGWESYIVSPDPRTMTRDLTVVWLNYALHTQFMHIALDLWKPNDKNKRFSIPSLLATFLSNQIKAEGS